VALSALTKLAKRGLIGKQDRVVVLSTASGLKFIDFKTGYHAEALPDVESRLANRPVELPGDLDSVLKAIAAVPR
jgi:threonine synthase